MNGGTEKNEVVTVEDVYGSILEFDTIEDARAYINTREDADNYKVVVYEWR